MPQGQSVPYVGYAGRFGPAHVIHVTSESILRESRPLPRGHVVAVVERLVLVIQVAIGLIPGGGDPDPAIVLWACGPAEPTAGIHGPQSLIRLVLYYHSGSP